MVPAVRGVVGGWPGNRSATVFGRRGFRRETGRARDTGGGAHTDQESTDESERMPPYVGRNSILRETKDHMVTHTMLCTT